MEKKRTVQHNMEMVKSRAYGDGVSAEQKNSAIFTLHKVLSTVLKLLAPITPFISDKIWMILYSSLFTCECIVDIQRLQKLPLQVSTDHTSRDK